MPKLIHAFNRFCNSRKTLWVIIVVAGIFLILQGIKLQKLKHQSVGLINREQGGLYFFTNPILDFELSQTLSEAAIPSGDIRRFVQQLEETSSIQHVSVYFRDLNNGPWIGINEKEYFSPASMLKTPLIIALYKWAEAESGVFSRRVLVEDRFFNNIPRQINTSSSQLVPGNQYTLLELGEKMIIYSDNVATNVLYSTIPKEYIDNTFLNIGVSRVDKGEEILLRVKDVASFYRILFNASYLNRQNSESVLRLLSETTYRGGLAAGVPESIKIAHKFGERFPSSFLPGQEKLKEDLLQIHDCGIIYFPKKPYILCVMTRGDDLKKQQNINRNCYFKSY